MKAAVATRTSGGSRDAVLAVNKDASGGVGAADDGVDEVEGIVECGRDVLACRVLQVELEVREGCGVVVGASQSRCVQNVCHAAVTKQPLVLPSTTRAARAWACAGACVSVCLRMCACVS